MLTFITRFFATIGFIVVFLMVIVVSGLIYAHQYGAESVHPEPESIVLTLDFDSPIVEHAVSSPLSLTMNGEAVELLDVVQTIDHAKDDPHVKGIVARFGTMQPSLAQTQEIRSALERFRSSHKFTYAFGSDFGAFGTGNRAYYLASAFENIWLQPVGTVSLTGLALQDMFAKTGLDKLGISADFMQREEYKSFMERAQRDGFSPLVKIEMQGLIDNLGDQIAQGIAQSRKMDLTHVKELMAQGPYTGEEAMQAGLVTRVAYADELDDEITKLVGHQAVHLTLDDYMVYTDTKPGKDVTPSKIALIFGTGLITDHSEQGGGLTGEHVMGADEIAGAFDDAAADKHVKAILFRVDSPGGSPSASETIRRALIHAQKRGKPVIVSMGDTAASGGYWISMNGDKIIADPSTLTGSIGVISGKFVADGLMQKLGITMDGVRTSENAGMWDITAPYSSAQRARVSALLDDTYHAFVSNVASARKIPMEKMPDLAKGRVWTGAQAVQNGLVDELGGFDVALSDVRKALHMADTAPLELQDFPQPLSPGERILKIMHRFGLENAELSTSLSVLAHLEIVLQPLLSLSASVQQPVSALMIKGQLHE